MRTRAHEPTPDGFKRCVITHVINHGDSLTIKYGTRAFGGIILAELTQEIAASIRPGTEVIVRMHTSETGDLGTVAHVLVPHPSEDGWAEVYEDY